MTARPGLRLLAWRLVLLGATLALAVGTSVAVLPAEPGQASTGPWSPPITLAEGAAWFPTIASDLTGRVHIVWNQPYPDQVADLSVPIENQPIGFGALYYVRRDAERWTTPIDVALIQRVNALRASLSTDAAGGLHLIYKGYGKAIPQPAGVSNGNGPEDLWHKAALGSRAELIQAWSEPKRVSRNAYGYYSDQAIDRKGALHAIWTESERGAWGIYYANSPDGATWSRRVVLDGDNFIWWYRAHLQADQRDWLHAVWERVDRRYEADTLSFTNVTGAVYGVSKDGGATWATTVQAGFQQPAVGVDGGGNILLVSRETGTDRVVFQRSIDGETWSAPLALPGVRAGIPRPYDVYDMVTDSDGHVHLALAAYAQGATVLSLLHLEWNGQQWGTHGVVAVSPPYPEYPKLAVSGGDHLHVVWFDGDRDSIDRVPIRVRYSDAITSAPTIPPAPPAPILDSAPAPSSAPPSPPGEIGGDSAPPQTPVGGDTVPSWGAPVRANSMYSLVLGLIPVVVLLVVSWLATREPAASPVARLLPWSRYGRH